jgi:alpha-glucosidase
LNTSSNQVSLPPGQVLLTSGPLPPSGDVLPPDTAVWLV